MTAGPPRSSATAWYGLRMFSGRAAGVGAGIVAAALVVGRDAHAEEVADDQLWRVHRVGLGLHLGAAVGSGQADTNLPMRDRVGFAPMMLFEGNYRLTRHLSVVGIGGAGVAAKKPSPCPDAAEGFRCRVTNLFELGALGRYHLTLGGPVEPWLGAGIAFGMMTDKAEKTETRGGSTCVVGCDGSELVTRSRNRLGPQGIVGAGMSIRFAKRFSAGFGIHAFVGSYTAGTTQDERKLGTSSPSTSFPVGGGAHVLMLATGSFLVHL